MRYFIIGDEDAVLGFSMVGVEGRVAVNSQEAENAFRSALNDRNIGIIIITERTAELIRPLVDRYIFSSTFPLILEIPDGKGPLAGKLSLREMINQAIGMKL